jgi:hypothetical protein
VGIGRTAFKIWCTASIVWIIAVGVLVNAGGFFPAHYQTDFSLRADLEPWKREWTVSDPLHKPLYEIIRSPSAENLPVKFQLSGYQGAIWNQHIHARMLPSFTFPSGETLDLPADLIDADRDYIKKAFWDQRWKQTLRPFARAAVYGPLGVLALLWIASLLRTKISGKEPAPEAPRLPYSPNMERLRRITLYASGVEILLWIVLGVLNQREDPQALWNAVSVMFIIMLPSLAAFVMSLMRRCPRTAAMLAARRGCCRNSSHASCRNPGSRRWGEGRRLFFVDRPAPAGQIIGIEALRQFVSLLQRHVEISHDDLSLDPPAQEIGPEKLAERRRVLGVAADAAQLAGKAAERIVLQVGDGFRDVVIMAADAVGVVGMHPGMVVEHRPERVAIELLQIGDDFHEHVVHVLFVQRQ